MLAQCVHVATNMYAAPVAPVEVSNTKPDDADVLEVSWRNCGQNCSPRCVADFCGSKVDIITIMIRKLQLLGNAICSGVGVLVPICRSGDAHEQKFTAQCTIAKVERRIQKASG